jgi:hypothetical protein
VWEVNVLPHTNHSSKPMFFPLTHCLKYSPYWLWQVLAVRRCRRGSAGSASQLPTRVVPSSSIDRACRGDSKSGLRIKWSCVLDSTDLNGYLSCIYATKEARRLYAGTFLSQSLRGLRKDEKRVEEVKSCSLLFESRSEKCTCSNRQQVQQRVGCSLRRS